MIFGTQIVKMDRSQCQKRWPGKQKVDDYVLFEEAAAL